MAKQTKNIITREGCKDEALKSIKSEIITYSIILAFSLLLYIPFFVIVGASFELGIFWGILMLLCCFCVHIVFICLIFYNVRLMQTIKREGVTVVIDRAVRFSEEADRMPNRRFATVKVIYFRDHDRQIYRGSLFELFENGDEFYLVVIKKRKEKVVAIYSTKLYELKD